MNKTTEELDAESRRVLGLPVDHCIPCDGTGRVIAGLPCPNCDGKGKIILKNDR